MEMYGYKGFESDLTCRDFQYELGKTFKHIGKIKLCKSGYHFCKTLRDVFNYYDFSDNHRFCRVKATGKIIEGADKCVTDEIEILEEIEITPELLKELAQSKDYTIRLAVAENPNTDLETLKKLAQDKDSDVRIAVAGNRKTDPETLKDLAEDKNWYVRQAVAENKNTDPETLKKLAKDTEWEVRSAACRTNTDL